MQEDSIITGLILTNSEFISQWRLALFDFTMIFGGQKVFDSGTFGPIKINFIL